MTSNDSYLATLRALVVCALITAAVAHIRVTPEHLHEAPYVGMAFIAFTVAAFVLAGVVAFSGGSRGYAASVSLCIAAIVVYALTRMVAFPQIGDDVGNWTETFGVVAVAAEVVASLAAGATLLARRRGTWPSAAAPRVTSPDRAPREATV